MTLDGDLAALFADVEPEAKLAVGVGPGDFARGDEVNVNDLVVAGPGHISVEGRFDRVVGIQGERPGRADESALVRPGIDGLNLDPVGEFVTLLWLAMPMVTVRGWPTAD